MDPNEESSKHGYLLIYRKNGQVGNPYHLHYGKTTIGSSNDVHIRLKTDLEIVEPIHCVLDSNSMGMAILENKSKLHPVNVNGQPIIDLHVLDTEDIFRVGKKSFKYMNEHIQKEDVMKLSNAIARRQGMGGTPLKRLNTRKSNSPFIRATGSRTQFPRRRYSLGSDKKIMNDSPGISMRNIMLSSRTTTPQSLKRLRFSRRFSTSKLPTLTSLKEDSYDENLDTSKLTSPLNESRTSRNLSNRTRIHNSSVNLTSLNMSKVNDSTYVEEGSKLNISKNMCRTPQNACNIATSNDESNVTPLNNTKSNKSKYLNVDTLPDSPKNMSRTSQNRSKNMSAKNTPLSNKSTGNITPLNTSKINRSKYSEVGSKLNSFKNVSRSSQNLSNISTPINNKSTVIVTPLNIPKINRSKFMETIGDDDATPKSAIKSRKSISEPYQPVVEEITPVSPTRKSARNKSLNIDMPSGYLGRMSRRSASQSMSTSLESFSSLYKTDRINLLPTTKGLKRRMSSMSSIQLQKRRCLSTHLVTDDASDVCLEDSISSSSIYDSFDESSVNDDNSITDTSMVKRNSTGRLSSRKSLRPESVISEQSSSRANLVSLLGDYPSSSNVLSDGRSTRRSRNSRRYSFTESSILENVTPLKSILKSRNNSIDSLYKSSTPFDKKQKDYIPSISIYEEKGNVSLSPVKELKKVSKRSSKVGSTPKCTSKSIDPVDNETKITDSSFDFSNNANTSLKSIVKSRSFSMKTPKQEEDYASFDFSNNEHSSLKSIVKSRRFSMKTPKQEEDYASFDFSNNEHSSLKSIVKSRRFSMKTPKQEEDYASFDFSNNVNASAKSIVKSREFSMKTPEGEKGNYCANAQNESQSWLNEGSRSSNQIVRRSARTPKKKSFFDSPLKKETSMTPRSGFKPKTPRKSVVKRSNLSVSAYSSPNILRSSIRRTPTGSAARRKTSTLSSKAKTPLKSSIQHINLSAEENVLGKSLVTITPEAIAKTLEDSLTTINTSLPVEGYSSPGIQGKSLLVSRSTPRKSTKSYLDLSTEDNFSPVVLGKSLLKGIPKAVATALTDSPVSRETSIIAGSKSKTPRKSTKSNLDLSTEDNLSPVVLGESLFKGIPKAVEKALTVSPAGRETSMIAGSKYKTPRKSALKHLDTSVGEYSARMNTSSNSNSPRKTTLNHLDLSIGDFSSPGILGKSSRSKTPRKSTKSNLNLSTEDNLSPVLGESLLKGIPKGVGKTPTDSPAGSRETSIISGFKSKTPRKSALKLLDMSVEEYSSPKVLQKSLIGRTNPIEDNSIDFSSDDTSIITDSGSKTKRLRKSELQHFNFSKENYSFKDVVRKSQSRELNAIEDIPVDSPARGRKSIIAVSGAKSKTPQKYSLNRLDGSIEQISSPNVLEKSLNRETNSVENYPVDSPAEKEASIDWSSGSKSKTPRRSLPKHLNSTVEEFSPSNVPVTSVIDSSAGNLSSTIPTPGTKPKTPRKSSLKHFDLSAENCSSTRKTLGSAGKAPRENFLTPPGSGFKMRTRLSKNDSSEDITDITSSFTSLTTETTSSSSNRETLATSSKHSLSSHSTSSFETLDEAPKEVNKRALKTSKRHRKSPLNDLSNVSGVKKLIATPKTMKSPKNDLTDIKGVKKMFSTPKYPKSPLNDLSNVARVKKLLATPKITNSPKNDLADIKGVKKMFSTPKERKSPKNDLTDIKGVKKMFSTPKERKSPKNDLTDIKGVKKMFSTPKETKSPLNDLSNVAGVKKMFRSPKVQNSPKNDLSEVHGVKKLFTAIKEPKSPINELVDVRGVKRLYKTPKAMKYPKNDLTNVTGVRSIFQTPKERKSPRNDLTDIPNLRNLIYPRYRSSPKNDLSNIDGIDTLFQSPNTSQASPKDNLFDSLAEKKVLRTYRNKSKSPRKTMDEVSTVSNHVTEWVNDQLTQFDGTKNRGIRRQNTPTVVLENIENIIENIHQKESEERICSVGLEDDPKEDIQERAKLSRTRRNPNETVENLEMKKSFTRSRRNVKEIASDRMEDADDKDVKGKLKDLGTKKTSATRKKFKEISGDETKEAYEDQKEKLKDLRTQKSTRTRKNLKEIPSDDESDEEDRREKLKDLGTNKLSTRTRKNLKPIPSDDIKDTDDEDSREKLKGSGTKKSSTRTKKNLKKIPGDDETDDEYISVKLLNLRKGKSSTRTKTNFKEIHSDDTKETDDEDRREKLKDLGTNKSSTRTRKNLKPIPSDDIKDTDDEDSRAKLKGLGTKKPSTRTGKNLKEIQSDDAKGTDDEELKVKVKDLGTKKSSTRTRKNLIGIQSDDTKETDDEDLREKLNDLGAKKTSTRTRKQLKVIPSDDTKKETDDEDPREKLKYLGAKKTSTRTRKQLKEIPSDDTKETDDDDPKKILNDLKPQLSDVPPSKITRKKGVATEIKVELLSAAPKESPSVSKNVRATRGISKKYKSEEWDTPTKVAKLGISCVKHEEESEAEVGTVKPTNSRKKILESEETVSLKSKTEVATVQIARRGRRIYDEDLLKTLYHETEITTRKPTRRGAKQEEDVENKNEKTETKLRKTTKRNIKNDVEDNELQMNGNESSEPKVRKTTRRVLRKDEDDVEQKNNKLEEIEHEPFAPVRKTTRKRPAKNEDVENENEQDLPDIIEKKKTRRGAKKYDDGQKENERPENQKHAVDEQKNALKRKGVLAVFNEDSEENAVPVARQKRNATKVVQFEAPEIRKSSRTRRK